MLSGFPGLAITQSRGVAGALSLTGAGLSTVDTLYCLNRRDFGVSAAALAPAVIRGTGHSLVTVAWQIPEVARFPMAGGSWSVSAAMPCFIIRRARICGKLAHQCMTIES